MEERLTNGEEVLIFRNVSDIYEQREEDFVKGYIISSEKSKNLSYGENHTPYYVWVYKVIGEDHKEYTCCNGMIIYGNDYIRRPVDYLKDIRNKYLDNLNKIKRLQEINESLKITLDSLDNLERKKISTR